MNSYEYSPVLNVATEMFSCFQTDNERLDVLNVATERVHISVQSRTERSHGLNVATKIVSCFQTDTECPRVLDGLEKNTYTEIS